MSRTVLELKEALTNILRAELPIADARAYAENLAELALVDPATGQLILAASSAWAGSASTTAVTAVDIPATSVIAGKFQEGSYSFASSTISNLGTVTTVALKGGSIQSASIGNSTAASGNFTTLQSDSLTVRKVAGVTAGGVVTKLSQTFGFADFTDDGGGAAHADFTVGDILAGAVFLAAAATSVYGFTGDTSCTLTLGDGTDADRYNTGTINVFGDQATGVDLGAPSGTRYHPVVKTPRVYLTSATGFGSVSAGTVAIDIYYIK